MPYHMYLRILEDSLTDPLDYWRICDAQIQYHMIHAQIRQDIPKTAEEGEEDYFIRCQTSRSLTAPAACLRRFSSIAA